MIVDSFSNRPPCWYGEEGKTRAFELEQYWSPTRHNLLSNCPDCFYRKYILKEPENPFKEREKKELYGYGSVVHTAVELSLAGKKIPKDEEIAAQVGLKYIDQVKEHIKLLKKKLKVLDLSDSQSETPFLCYLQHPENKEDKLDIPMFGILDLSKLFTKDGADMEMRIADVKSSTQKWGRAKCMKHYQFKGYTYVGWALTGKVPEFDCITLIKADHAKGRDATVENQPVPFDMTTLVDFYEETKLSQALAKQMINGDWKREGCSNWFFCPKW